MLLSWFLFLLVGAVSGFAAGLLGLGGGAIIVPTLSLVLSGMGFSADATHRVAIGTSLATIVFTSALSARKHNQAMKLDWPSILAMAPSLVAGTLGGSFLSAMMSAFTLRGIFLVFLLGLAVQIAFFPGKAKSAGRVSRPVMAVCGLLIGILASVVGIAGGVILVPFLLWTGLPMHGAIGASSMLGVFLSSAGTAGAVVSGLMKGGLPPGTFGYVHLGALAGMVVGGTLMAPVGVKIAYRLSARALRLIFGAVMLLMVAVMAWSMLRGGR